MCKHRFGVQLLQNPPSCSSTVSKKSNVCRSLLSLDMHNEVRKERYNIKYFVGCEDMLAKYIKETCNMADFSDSEILTALGLY
jgi:hypothetical protein